MTARTLLLAPSLVLAGTVLASCAGPTVTTIAPREFSSPLPYSLLIDLGSLSQARDGERRETENDGLTLRTVALEQALRQEFEKDPFCALLSFSERRHPDLDSLRAAARRRNADVILYVDSERPPVARFSHNSNWFLPNTFLWFLAGFPSFWVRDRVYEMEWRGDLVVEAVGTGDELLREQFVLERLFPLNLAEQGFTARALYTPPGFYDGPELRPLLGRHAETWIVDRALALLHREHLDPAFDWPVKIAVTRRDARRRGTTARLRFDVVSKRPLTRFRVDVDQITVAERDRFSLRPRGRTVDGGRRYRFEIDVPHKSSGQRKGRDANWESSRTMIVPIASGARFLVRVLASSKPDGR